MKPLNQTSATKIAPKNEEQLREALFTRSGSDVVDALSKISIGIAGLGGLGSNIAVHLVRSGAKRLTLVDYDRVDYSNLNRQFYNLSHIGKPKTEALCEELLTINPYLELTTHQLKLTPDNAPMVFSECDIICEAFDRAEEKAWFIATMLSKLPKAQLVSGSGMAGIDSANLIQTHMRMGKFFISGDGESDIENSPHLVSSRVGVCAAHEAHMVIRLALGFDTA